MKHLVIGQRLKTPNFLAFHWSPHGSLVSIGQNFVTIRVVHLPKRTETSLTRHRKRYNPLALYHSSYWSHCWMDTHFLMYLLRVLQHLNIKKNCDPDINHRPLKHEPIKDMFILSIGMATSLISLCFSIIGIRSRSQLLLEENFFHCSGLLIFRLNLT